MAELNKIDEFTVEQAIDAIGFGRFQVKLSLLAGLAWMADAMEMMILSILSPALHCNWGIPTWQQALITTLVFVGMMCGSSFWGFICDKYGRKSELILSSLFTFYFGLLSSFSPTYTWMLILRGIVGFGIGGAPQAVTLYSEFLPSQHRAKCVVLIELAWAIGAMFEVVLALIIMPYYGWRLLLILSAFPLLVFALTCVWLPESARFLFACNQPEKVMQILKRVADDNRSQLPPGTLVAGNKTEQRGRIQDLFMPELFRTTLLLWFIWFSNAFSYYGIVLFSTALFEVGDNCHAPSSGEDSCKLDCHLLSTKDYTDLLWTTVAEFPGLFITVLIIERFGRRITMGAEFAVFSISAFVLTVCIPNRIGLTVVLFIARAFISGAFQGAYVYTPEVYPTVMRAIGLGSCSTMARIGAIITPFVAQVLIETSPKNPAIVYGVVGLLAAGASLLLPIETKGREMKDSVGH